MPKKITLEENFGSKFVSDHRDAEIEFYWAIKASAEIPKNKVLTGVAQSLQKVMQGHLFIGVFRRGIFDYNHLYYNFQDICKRSLKDVVIVDQFGTGYNGRQFLEIIEHSSIR